MRGARALVTFLVLAVLAVLSSACSKKPKEGPAPEPTVMPDVRDSSEGLLFVWIDERGDFRREVHTGDVPAAARDLVRVIDPTRDEPEDRVFVADLRALGPDGTYAVHASPRADFEKIAVDRRAKTGPTLASAAPRADAPPNGSVARGGAGAPSDGRPLVIIYGADWCGACHEAAAYLKAKGIAFIEKNIETDAGAAREMQQKLAKAGMHGGSIPVLDVRGQVMIGFNPRSVDAALGKAI